MEKDKQNQGRKSESVSLAPLDTEQAVAALLRTKPMKKPKKKGKNRESKVDDS